MVSKSSSNRTYFLFLIMPVINTPIDIPYKIPTTKSLKLDVLFKTIAKTRNNIPIGTYLFLFNFIFLASTNYYYYFYP